MLSGKRVALGGASIDGSGKLVRGERMIMGFGGALQVLKQGGKVARLGWNGKGMFLILIPGSTFQVAEGRPMAKHWPVGAEVQYRPHIDMKTAQGDVVPWVASQSDLLTEDWVPVP